uniref:Uncharacterized protein n=1 Tax=Strigamia maritima TaxID=126957 RepID=T1IRG5_STRMM
MASSADELYGKGNEAFVKEEYALAVEFYTKAIEIDSRQADYYENRANSQLKLKKYEDAKIDVDKAFDLGMKVPKLWLWKGIACFEMKEYKKAQEVFLDGKMLHSECNDTFDMWLDQCKTKLQQISEASSQRIKIRHEWYQTEVSVFVTILVKNAKRDEVVMEITKNTLQCNVQGNDKRLAFELNITLEHEINPKYSVWKILPSKIEIQLKKCEGIQWKTLHETPKENIKQFVPDKSSITTNKYPTSCSTTKDWDKIVTDIKKDEEIEQQDGEAAVNQLFQKIYSEGSDEVKKAMNKSFTESGGTVLSTNWTDVEKQKTTVKPPDGMEWKQWDS